MYRIIIILYLLSVVNIAYSGFGEYGKWHPELGKTTDRPRILLMDSEKTVIQNRISNGYQDFRDLYGQIYSSAEQTSDPRTNWKKTDRRSYLSKQKAFVYYINRSQDGSSPLDATTRETLKDQAINYLLDLNASVQTNWGDYWNIQWRAKELVNYCEAYDLLMGDADSEILANSDQIEENLHTFAANIFYILDYWKEPGYLYGTTKLNHRILGATALGIAAQTIGYRGADSNDRSDINNRKWRPNSWIGAAMNTIYYLLRTNSSSSLVTSDGAYKEGPHYAKYVATIFLPFNRGMKNFQSLLGESTPWIESYYNFGNDWADSYNLENPYTNSMFQTIYDYYTKIKQPEGRLPSIKDTYIFDYFPELALMAEHKAFYSWPIISYDPNNLSDFQQLNNSLFYAGTDNRIDYICAGYEPTNEGLESLNWKFQSLQSAGSYVTRTGWHNEAYYFHLHGDNQPWGSTDHYHEDAGSFILNLKKRRLLIDPGYIKWGHQHHDEMVAAFNHNLIMVDDKGPKSTTRSQHLNSFYSDWLFFNRISTGIYVNQDSENPFAEIYRSVFNIKDPSSENIYSIIYDEGTDLNTTNRSFKFILHGIGLYDSDPNLSNFGIDEATRIAWWKSNYSETVKCYNRSIPDGSFTHAVRKHETGYDSWGEHSVLYAEANNTVSAKYLSVITAYNTNPQYVTDVSQTGNSYKAYLIDKGASSQNFEIAFMQEDVVERTIPLEQLVEDYGGELETDAEMLLISLPKNYTSEDDIELIAQRASYTYLNEGKLRIYPNNADEFCTDFSITDYHMKSDFYRATGYNNGRRIAVDLNGTLHAVYEDDYKIWYTYSSDAGATWAKETKLDDTFPAKNPSLDLCINILDITIHVVYESIIPIFGGGDAHVITWQQKTTSGWQPPEYICNGYLANYADYTWEEGDSGERPTIFAESGNYLLVAWRDLSSGRIKIRNYVDQNWGTIGEVNNSNGYPVLGRVAEGDLRTKIIWA